MLENIEVTLPCLLGIRTDIRLCLIGLEISFEDRGMSGVLLGHRVKKDSQVLYQSF